MIISIIFIVQSTIFEFPSDFCPSSPAPRSKRTAQSSKRSSSKSKRQIYRQRRQRMAETFWTRRMPSALSRSYCRRRQWISSFAEISRQSTWWWLAKIHNWWTCWREPAKLLAAKFLPDNHSPRRQSESASPTATLTEKRRVPTSSAEIFFPVCQREVLQWIPPKLYNYQDQSPPYWVWNQCHICERLFRRRSWCWCGHWCRQRRSVTRAKGRISCLLEC